MRHLYLRLAAIISLTIPALTQAAPLNEQDTQTATLISGKLEKHKIVMLHCPDCNYRESIRSVLKRLGAVEMDVTNTTASFSVLVPLQGNDQVKTDSPGVKGNWNKVTFRIDAGNWHYKDGVDRVIYEQLKGSILPLFTTRNMEEKSGNRLSIEVLRPVRD